MTKRFVSIWFRHLVTDWFALRKPELRTKAFVLRAPLHGRMVVTATNALAEAQGICTGMTVADARALLTSLEVLDEKPGLAEQLTHRLAEWSIRFTPSVALDPPEGLMFDATGCSHLWGGDQEYITLIITRFKERGFHVRAAMADTMGAAWALARYGNDLFIAESGAHMKALLSLPPMALRLDMETTGRLNKLGLRRIGDFISMPHAVLRRRFGQTFINRLQQALGNAEEMFKPVLPVEPYQERLPCLDPIITRKGIEIALQRLLESICTRLQQEQKGLRLAKFTCHRVDGKIVQVEIATTRPSANATHLFKLFELKISSIEPGLGIELFLLEATTVEDHASPQEKLWGDAGSLQDVRLSELMDRLMEKFGADRIGRYLPAEHYWPERSYKPAVSLYEKPTTAWRIDRPRPLQLLTKPELIQVTAPIPDYPPMIFRYKGKLHTVKKADGPERIEREWWLDSGEHRDYYVVEDQQGHRYWIFRLGHYDTGIMPEWFLHGFFA